MPSAKNYIIMILIYPYWNVDYRDVITKIKQNMILIYPYWNVDVMSGTKLSVIEKILIYPYWNVDRRR